MILEGARAYEYLDPAMVLASSDFAAVDDFVVAIGRPALGWHYITDLAWIYRHARTWPAGITVLDAGGGTGPVQFLLAEMGFHVTNIDLMLPKTHRLSFRYRLQRQVLPSYQASGYLDHLKAEYQPAPLQRLLAAGRGAPPFVLWSEWRCRHALEHWRTRYGIQSEPGTIRWLVGNLTGAPELSSASFAAVVSLSALEHVERSQLPALIDELNRLLAPDGRLAITTSASATNLSWYHEPSHGWCFSPDDLQTVFGAVPAGGPSADVVLGRYQENRYLRTHLARFYRRSGKNGMPWGRWDPKYVPVGIFR